MWPCQFVTSLECNVYALTSLVQLQYQCRPITCEELLQCCHSWIHSIQYQCHRPLPIYQQCHRFLPIEQQIGYNVLPKAQVLGYTHLPWWGNPRSIWLCPLWIWQAEELAATTLDMRPLCCSWNTFWGGLHSLEAGTILREHDLPLLQLPRH